MERTAGLIVLGSAVDILGPYGSLLRFQLGEHGIAVWGALRLDLNILHSV